MEGRRGMGGSRDGGGRRKMRGEGGGRWRRERK